MEQEKGRRRPKVKRFTAPRRAAFLEFLATTGNWTAAAEMVGIDRSTADQRRKRDAQFALDCMAAREAADRRLAGAGNAFDASGQGDFNVIRRGRGGRTQVIRAGAKRWSRAIEDQFFAALVTCGNVAAAARAVGFTEGCIWTRRRTWPAFRARMEEVLDDADLRIEFRLAAMGSDIAAAGPGGPDGDDDGEGDGAETGAWTAAPDAMPFDPDMAFRYLKWREEKRRGGGQRGRPERRATEAEVTESIMRKLAVVERRDAKQKLAEGWSRDEAAECWIPPGWVRRGEGNGNGNGEDGNGDSR